MRISIMIEGQMGLNWDRWKAIARVVEDEGFAGLFRSDHFTNPSGPDEDSLELLVSLTWLATNTNRIHFGPLVSPVSFRDPVMLTRQGAALADLSDGRFILGLGAGWQDREHREHGYDLGSIRTRLDRLQEGMEIATRLLRGEGPQTFEGSFFQIRDAMIRPAPAHRVPIMLGGNGPKRSVPMAARYADIWNGLMPTPEAARERNRQLDRLLAENGRAPEDLERTMMTGLYFGADGAALERRLEPLLDHPQLQGKTTSEIVTILREKGAIVGTPEDVQAQLKEYEGAGVDEMMLQWLTLDDLDGLRAFAAATVH